MTPAELEAELQELHGESFGWALSCCGWDESQAEDVLQTTYVKVLSGSARFGGRSAFKTWLFGVIRRTAQELERRARSHRKRALALVTASPVDVAESPDIEASLQRAEESQALIRALEQLPERQREVLHLVFYQGMTVAEAAGVMGVSVGSARTHYDRGKKRMRTILSEGER